VFRSNSPACFRPMGLMSGVGQSSTCHVKGAPSVVRDLSNKAMISVC